MKAPSPFLRGYLKALRKHLNHDPARKPGAAGILGATAVKLGLGAPDLARVHSASLMELRSEAALGAGAKSISSAGIFFAGVVAPIEAGHRAVRKANLKLTARIESLGLRSSKLTAANTKLKREIGRRKTREAELEAGEQDCSRLLEESLRQQDDLRLLSRQLISAQEDERKRISRDLHDVVAQALTGINFRLAEINMQNNAGAKKMLGKIAATQALLENSMQVVHSFAVGLRPSVLDDLGLIPALRSDLERFMDDSGIHVGFTAAAEVEELPSAARTALFRAVQEALANVARHAGSRRAEIRITVQGRFIRLEVADEGKGFRHEVVSAAGRGVHLGLLGMKERVEMVGGTLQIISAPSKGTTIRVEIPRPDSKRSGKPRGNRTKR